MTDKIVVPFQPPRKPPLTGAERAARYRAKKKAERTVTAAVTVTPLPVPVTVTPVTVAKSVTPITSRITFPRVTFPHPLTIAAIASAASGLAINSWYARSLGSSDIAGMLFLLVGAVADVASLMIPSSCVRLAAKRQYGAAAIGWLVWAGTFLFAICSGIGFASTNISDTVTSRAARATPLVTQAQDALRDATAARDRECRDGVGKFCRVREQAVIERRQALDVAMRDVRAEADPQTEALSRSVAWLTLGLVKPTEADFATLRLLLLAALPQLGGILLMLGRGAR